MSEIDAPDWPCKMHGHTWAEASCECLVCGILFCIAIPGYSKYLPESCAKKECEKLFWYKLFRGEGD